MEPRRKFDARGGQTVSPPAFGTARWAPGKASARGPRGSAAALLLPAVIRDRARRSRGWALGVPDELGAVIVAAGHRAMRSGIRRREAPLGDVRQLRARQVARESATRRDVAPLRRAV